MDEVKGIGEGAPDGWTLEEYEVPLPKSLDEIMAALRGILGQGRIQSVSLDLKKPIRFTRFVHNTEATQKRVQEDEGGMVLGEAARNVEMTEYYGEKKTPAEILIDMMLAMEVRRLYVTHIGVGSSAKFFGWLGFDAMTHASLENLGGARLVQDKTIPDDIVIVFGGPYRAGRADQITYAFKEHMPTQGSLEDQSE